MPLLNRLRRRLLTIAPGLVGLVCSAASSQAQVIYVDAQATGAQDGTSWADAFADLQEALSVAVSGHEIWVAQGTYRPAADTSFSSQKKSFVLVAGVKWLGGFSGRESSAAERDPERYPTILSGDLGGDDDPASFLQNENTSDNSEHVVVGTDIETTCVLDGFVITGGKGGPFEALCEWSWGGGGLLLQNTNVVIRDCRITLNRTQFTGGGCLVEGGESVVFENCEFFQNLSAGFISVGGGALSLCETDASIAKCRFEDNRAKMTEALGGAILAQQCSPLISDCEFIGNRAAGGGAIYAEDDSDLVVVNSMFHANLGGAMAAVEDSDVTIARCAFLANTSIYVGGALFFRGSAYSLSSDGIVRDCLFVANDSEAMGGAIGIDTSNPAIENCTIVHNTCGFGTAGAGIYFTKWSLSPSISIRNSILWQNSASGVTDYGAQVGDESEWFDIAISHSCIEGLDPGHDEQGNTGSAPTFIDPAGADLMLGTEDDDFRLAGGSTGIDQGDPSEAGRVCDAQGMPRRLDGDLNGTAVVDMGAMEFGHVVLSAVEQVAPGAIVEVGIQGTGSLSGWLLVGHGEGSGFVGSFGALLFDPQQRWERVFVGPLPASLHWTMPVQVPTGATFTLQALGVVPSTTIGNFSNAVSLTVSDA